MSAPLPRLPIRFSQVLLDCDGCIADWHLGCAQTLSDNGYSVSPTPEAVTALAEEMDAEWGSKYPRAVEEIAGTSRETLWALVSDPDGEWWANLPPTNKRFPGVPMPALFVAALEETQPAVTLFTAAPTDTDSFAVRAACLAGKARWIGTHFGGHFTRYVITGSTPVKRMFPYQDALLIDDSPKNCEACVKRGGTAWLFNAGKVSKACSYDARNFPAYVEEILSSLKTSKVN